MIRRVIILGLLIVFSLSLIAIAEEELTGNEILEKVDEQNQAKDGKIKVKMTIVNEKGQKMERQLEIFIKEDDKSLITFLSPADVEGTKFLTVGDDMWLYLPALGKVRRIASHMKNKSFMQTDFSYSDIGGMGSSYEEDYDATLIGSEEIEGSDCYVLESQVTKEDSEYDKAKVWVRKDIFLVVKVELYEDSDLKKLLIMSDVTQEGQYWIGHHIEMHTVKKGSKTVMDMESVEFDIGLDDSYFTKRYLER